MRTIRHYVDRRARETPDAPYVIAPETGATLAYAQLQRDSLQLAAFLLNHGLGKGDKVALMLHNSYQTARLLIGVMYAGCMVAPLNLLAQTSQLTYVLDHSDSKLVFTNQELAPRVREALAHVKRGIEVVVIDPDAVTIFDAQAEAALPDVSEDDDALLMYTSGTTGKPKGCVLSNRSVVAGGKFTSSAHQLTAQDRVLCAMPLYHINGQIVTTVAPLVHGGSVVMPHRFSASNYWELVVKHQCTWINVVPTMISYLLEGEAPSRECTRDIRFCRSASAALSPDHLRAFEQKFGISIIETMGLTETVAPAFSNPLDPARRKVGAVGLASGCEARVIDGNMIPVADGVTGELAIRGPNVMRGYYKNENATRAAFTPDGWLRTGDLGLRDSDGFFFVTGRIKELIIKGGENIAPREIDEAILRHPGVLDAAAVGIPDKHYGQEIMVCVVPRPEFNVTEDALRDYCFEHLGRYKTPKVIRFVNELPRGPSGKVQRLKLLE